MKATRTLFAALAFAATALLFGCDKAKVDAEAEFGGPDRDKRQKMMEKTMTADQKAKAAQQR